jgi:hypothetical protein
MYMILRCATGARVLAVLLAATYTQMRAILDKVEDTVEFRFIDDQWISEDGFTVEIESLVASDPGAVERVMGEMRARVVHAVS